MTLVTAYAWTNEHEYDVRHDFFTDLLGFTKTCASHGPTILLGGFNARLLRRFPREEHILGEHILQNPSGKWVPTSNRELLLELCEALEATVTNTLFNNGDERKTTYYDLGAKPSEPIVPGRFEQLDHVVVANTWRSCIANVWSDRGRQLQSHHSAQVVDLEINIEKKSDRHRHRSMI